MPFAALPTSVVYAIPVAVIVVIAWALQRRGQLLVRAASKIPTNVNAEKALEDYLQGVSLANIPVQKGDDYSKNEYSIEKGKILLSPDTFGSIDVGSLVLAVRAGSQASVYSSNPGAETKIRRLRNLETLVFWVVFCLLAFGIMSSSLPLTVAGYALVAVVFIIDCVRKGAVRSVNSSARKFLEETSLLDDKQRATALSVLEII